MCPRLPVFGLGNDVHIIDGLSVTLTMGNSHLVDLIQTEVILEGIRALWGRLASYAASIRFLAIEKGVVGSHIFFAARHGMLQLQVAFLSWNSFFRHKFRNRLIAALGIWTYAYNTAMSQRVIVDYAVFQEKKMFCTFGTMFSKLV